MSDSALGILDAIENLNILVDIESLEDLEATEDYRLIAHSRAKETYWASAGLDKQTIVAIRQTFAAIYAYIEAFYSIKKKEKSGSLEGINSVMVLVGEAARKLDRFGQLFHMKVTNFPEYLKLQDFYQTKLSRERVKKVESTRPSKETHLLDNIDLVKEDRLYELFYLKDENGADFYSAKLARRIKLYCDFSKPSENDPIQAANWKDYALYLKAGQILEECKSSIDLFYKEGFSHKSDKWICWLCEALMALMLASKTRHLMRQLSRKSCYDYFQDFLFYIRAALHDPAYSKLLLYRDKQKPYLNTAIALLSELVAKIYTAAAQQSELKEIFAHWIPSSQEKLSQQLQKDYQIISEKLAHHPNAALFKALELLDGDKYVEFDPYMQGNLPEQQMVLKWGDEQMHIFRAAAPVRQHEISHATILEEFICYLRSLRERHLFFNFVGSNSWTDEARCRCLESLSLSAEFAPHLTVVTMGVDTDFYHNHKETSSFITAFKEQIKRWKIPAKCKEIASFIDPLLAKIHKTFFENKESLTPTEREEFISLACSFIQWKIIEIVKPKYITMGSKDGLDYSAVEMGRLIALLGITRKEPLDAGALALLLFGPTLLQRERLIFPEAFDRLVATIKLLESKEDYLKPFAALFQSFDYRM